MMTRLEQEVLEIARHDIPEIAKQLGRLADGIETIKKLTAKQVEEEEEEEEDGD